MHRCEPILLSKRSKDEKLETGDIVKDTIRKKGKNQKGSAHRLHASHHLAENVMRTDKGPTGSAKVKLDSGLTL